VDLELIKKWICTCNDEHREGCKPDSTDHIERLKVIDCVERAIVSAPANCEFVALSYVWGQVSTAKGDETEEETEQLPPTILDAEYVTKSLGYRYLWVDRYVSARLCDFTLSGQRLTCQDAFDVV
jgi:hypothetical protein